MRKVTIEKIESATVVTIEKDGKIQKKATSKSRDVRPVHGGVKIMPEKNETQFNNMIIKLEELTDDFGASTPNELIEVFAEKGFFFESQTSLDNNQEEGCFHLVDHTLSMCNVYTVWNEKFISNGRNRIVLFFEVPDFDFSNIRATINLGSTKLITPTPFIRTAQVTNIPPLTIKINTSIYSSSEYKFLTRIEKTIVSPIVSYSKISGDIENFPGNFSLKLRGNDGIDNPDSILPNIENYYPINDSPLKVKGVHLNDGRKGLFIYLPQDFYAGILSSFFINLSSLEVTFQNSINTELYKAYPKASIHDLANLPEHESIEIHDIVNGNNSTPIGS
ncbi:hypothetical protein [uncultured Tenacibaculum sp.]|uniref:hypothetical protein n=1 Tax=uncultured Tenacibaculum sp. TaxID=174713 RepID=UPI0026306057|nr:hypothetical protein [uncultured Tenacibaculum sp.]